MKKLMMVVGVVAMSFATPILANAQQKTVADPIQAMINGNLSGVQKIKRDSKNAVVSLVVIGRAAVTRSLTKAKAKRDGLKKADADARNEFAKWLNTSVKWMRTDKNETVICQKGESYGDKGDAKSSESAEAKEMSKEESTQMASGYVKGAQQIGAGINEDGEAVVILGWSAANAMGADGVNALNQPTQNIDPSRTDNGNGGENAHPSVPGPNSNGDNVAPNPSVSASDDAGTFL